jgi:hypothetical protein
MNRNRFENLTRRFVSGGGSRRALPRLAGAFACVRMTLLAALIALAALLLHAPFVGAKVVQDANCGTRSSNVTKLFGSRAYSQSFAALQTGTLVSGFVETYNVQNAPATYWVDLWDAASGLPTGTAPLASTTVVHPAQGYHFNYPTFATPVKVKAGHTYAWVVTVQDVNNNGVLIALNASFCDTFALSNGGAFQSDSNNRDLVFSVNVKVKRHRHHH